MIEIQDKSKCCGCNACASICPHQCIKLRADEKGFLYPNIDKTSCIDCELCVRVCPMLKLNKKPCVKNVLAAINSNEESRYASSSGGIFIQFAELVISQQGVVFGAKFNSDFEVVHSSSESIEGIQEFQGSKYVQSNIGDSYIKAQEYLKAGRFVLFSGTGCQIAGLKNFLRRDYDNLLSVEILCHGVPSPLIWKKYLESTTNNNKVKGVSFRDKTEGWYRYSLSLRYYKDKDAQLLEFRENKFENPYLLGYFSDTFLRDSCFHCLHKEGKSGSDILLADFWGIEKLHPDLFDDKGCSCIITFTQKGELFVSKLSEEKIKCSIDEFKSQNPCYSHPPVYPSTTESFWKDFRKNGVMHALLTKARPSFMRRLKSQIISVLLKSGRVKI